MRTLTIADNWKDWKFGDTDAVMTFTALDDDKVPDFSNRTLTFKIASTLNNDLEHPKDFAATATGYIQGKDVILKTEDVKQLTPGNYIVELWAMSNDTQKDAVYPSKGFAQFTIEENSMKVSDVTNIPSMTINAFWNAVMQKVRTLTKGAKGDPGKTPKIVIGSVTKLSPDAQPSATLVPLQSDPNTYTLNLQLPQGVQGEQGLQGIPGVGSKGLDGNNGLTPTIDPKTKHWMIGGTDTGVIAEGQAGKDAGDISDLKGEVTGARGRFTNMADREDAQDAEINQKESIVNANANYAALKQKDAQQDAEIASKAGKFELEEKLSQMHMEPEGFENLDDLKAKYPNGNSNLNVTVNDGHLYIWFNDEWRDCGQYQTGSSIEEVKDARIWNSKLGKVKSDTLGNAIRQQFDQVEAQFNNILDTAIPDMTDQSGKIVPKQKLKLDKSLTSEVLPAQAKAVRDAITLQPERYQQPFTWYNESLPILKIEGQIPAADGVKSQVSYSYQGMNGSATLKWQGQSSLSFPKKNFTIKFDKSFTAKGGWLATDTYVLKGNFNDFTHARNIVSARLWGDIVKSRGWSTEDILDNDGTPLLDNDGTPLQIYQDTMPGLINGGAIDGFPIMLVVNGDFYGLYDFQIKKSRTMFGFEKDNHSQYAISCERTPQNKNGEAIHFKGAAILDGNDYDYEYVADDGDKANAKASFNYMLQKVVDATGSDYAKTLEGYLDVDSVIDYMLFTALITAADDVTKNFLMLSYNGTKWYFSAYDMDCTFGNWQDGWIREDPDHAVPSIQHWRDANRAMHLVCAYDADRVKARYQELRKGPLSDTNVYKRFISYMSLTPVAVKNADVKLWPTTPATVAHSFSQIFNEFKLRVSVIDQQIANL